MPFALMFFVLNIAHFCSAILGDSMIQALVHWSLPYWGFSHCSRAVSELQKRRGVLAWGLSWLNFRSVSTFGFPGNLGLSNDLVK